MVGALTSTLINLGLFFLGFGLVFTALSRRWSPR